MIGNSKSIVSNQFDVHVRLKDVVSRHLLNAWQKPIAAHTERTFNAWRNHWEQTHSAVVCNIVLDSGCGTGESTARLGLRNPNQIVVGVDQSAARLQARQLSAAGFASRDNVSWLRVEAADFWRLLHANNIRVAQHYLLYPNPWPKAEHLMRRWQGHPAFGTLMAISDSIELRTNWMLYAKEFACAVELWRSCNNANEPRLNTPQIGKTTMQSLSLNNPASCVSPFEAKYLASNHPLWCVKAELHQS